MKLQVMQMFCQRNCEYITIVLVLPCALINLMSFNSMWGKIWHNFYPF